MLTSHLALKSEYMLPGTPVRSSEHEMGRDQRTSWLYYLPAEAMVSIVHSTDIELTNMYHVLATWKGRGESTQDCQHLIVNSLFEGSHGHSHPRNDGSRNEERGTRKGTWDGFLHCGNENIPNSHPGTTFPECGTHPRSTFPVTIPETPWGMILKAIELGIE